MSTLKKTFLATAIAAGVLSMEACSGGSKGGSNPEPSLAPDPQSANESKFEFAVAPPEATLADLQKANTLSEAIELIAAIIAPKTMANDSYIEEIQVAIINSAGFVTEIVTPKSLSYDSTGQVYSLVLEGGTRIDCIIGVDVTGVNGLKVGDRLNPETGLFTPAIEVAEPFRVDLASSIAYEQFVENVDDFNDARNNVSIDELDKIVEGVQELVEELEASNQFSGLADLAALIEVIEESAAPIVATEVRLAEITKNDGNNQGDQTQGSYATDKAVIKAFFDDANTIAYIAGGFVATEKPSPIEQLQEQAETASDALSSAQPAIDSLGDLADTVATYIDDNDIDISDTKQTINFADIFAEDPRAEGITGSVIFDYQGLSLSLSGSYANMNSVGEVQTEGVEISDLSLIVTGAEDSTNLSLSLSGAIDSEQAELNIVSGSLTTSNVELNSSVLDRLDNVDGESELDIAIENYIDGFQQAQVSLNLVLTAKSNGEALVSDAVFTGDLSAEFVRSRNDFQEYVIPLGDGEVDAAEFEAYYNLKSASLNGRFESQGEAFEADVQLASSNADDFVPVPMDIGVSYDVAYTDLVAYKYDGESEFILQTPNYERRLFSETVINEYIVEQSENSYVNEYYGYTSFDDYLENDQSFISCDTYDNYYGYYTISFSDIPKGEDKLVLPLIDGDENAPATYEVDYAYSSDQFSYTCNDYTYTYSLVNSYYAEDFLENVVVINTTELYRNRTGYTDADQYLTSGLYGFYYYQEVDSNDYIDAYYRFSNPEYDDYENLVLAKGDNLPISLTLDEYNDYSSVAAPETLAATYTYTDTQLTIKVGDNILYNREIAGTEVVEEEVYTKQYSYGYTYSYPADWFESFDQFVQEDNYGYYGAEIDGIGYFEGYQNEPLLVSNDFIPVDMYLVDSDLTSGEETVDAYRELDVDVTLTAELNGLGVTTVEASLIRTGLESGLVSVTIENVSDADVSADITVTGAYANDDFGAFVISNDAGFNLKSSDIEEGDVIRLVYGLATAKVELTDAGLKVSYPVEGESDVLFDVY